VIKLDTTAPGTVDVAESSGGGLFRGWVLPEPMRPIRTLQQLLEHPGWTIPEQAVAGPVRLTQRLGDVKAWTGWSARALAEVTGTSHPTINAVLQGQAATLTRAPGLATRIRQLHDLVSRLQIVVGGDSAELTRALKDRPAPGRRSAAEELAAGEPADAYLAALDVLSPPRTTGMMRSRFPARPGEASSALNNE
jgi:hypothetical protein